MSDKNKLPALKDLVSDVTVYEEQDQLNFLLNQQPPEKWVAHHPYIKQKNDKGQTVPYKYLPIDKVEYLLRKIFKQYRIEILREGTSFNGVFVVVRVHYLNMITNKWEYHDGIGASALQTKAGKSPSDLVNINNGALSMAFPIAKTLAIKDACDMFGKLFGADLNRRDTLNASLDKPKTKDEVLEEQRLTRLTNHIKNAKSIKELEQVDSIIKTTEQDELYKEKYKKLKNINDEK